MGGKTNVRPLGSRIMWTRGRVQRDDDEVTRMTKGKKRTSTNYNPSGILNLMRFVKTATSAYSSNGGTRGSGTATIKRTEARAIEKNGDPEGVITTTIKRTETKATEKTGIQRMMVGRQ